MESLAGHFYFLSACETSTCLLCKDLSFSLIKQYNCNKFFSIQRNTTCSADFESTKLKENALRKTQVLGRYLLSVRSAVATYTFTVFYRAGK